MRENTTKINLRVSIVADFPIFVIIHNPLLARILIALVAIKWAVLIKWVLIAAVIGGTFFGKIEFIALGVVIFDRVWVFAF